MLDDNEELQAFMDGAVPYGHVMGAVIDRHFPKGSGECLSGDALLERSVGCMAGFFKTVLRTDDVAIGDMELFDLAVVFHCKIENVVRGIDQMSVGPTGVCDAKIN
jgi:hypothetical protein